MLGQQFADTLIIDSCDTQLQTGLGYVGKQTRSVLKLNTEFSVSMSPDSFHDFAVQHFSGAIRFVLERR